MAYDKVVDSSVLDDGLGSIADAIRTKGGTTGVLAFPDGFVSAIEWIHAGGAFIGTFTPATDSTEILIELEDAQVYLGNNLFVLTNIDLMGAFDSGVIFYSAYNFSGTQAYVSYAFANQNTVNSSRNMIGNRKFGYIVNVNSYNQTGPLTVVLSVMTSESSPDYFKGFFYRGGKTYTYAFLSV